MNEQSDTPRTDDETRHCWTRRDGKYVPCGTMVDYRLSKQLERELAEYKKCFEESHQNLTIEVEEVERLKLELTALTEQRDGLKQAVDCASDLLASITEQRDRLAEAMRQMWPFIEEDDYPNCNTPAFNAAILKYKEALQSLTTNTKDQERKSPASGGSQNDPHRHCYGGGGNNIHCGCKYNG